MPRCFVISTQTGAELGWAIVDNDRVVTARGSRLWVGRSWSTKAEPGIRAGGLRIREVRVVVDRPSTVVRPDRD